MVRRHGRAPRGERLVCKVPFGAWTTLTFIAALRHDRVTAPLLLEGAMNGQIFRAYVEQMLAPTLQPGDVVVMDNVRRFYRTYSVPISWQRKNCDRF